CNGQTPEICWINTKMHCLEACLEEDPDPSAHCQYRIRLVVECEFFAMETGKSIICLPVCPSGECSTIPKPYQNGWETKCYEEESQCDDWCELDEISNPTGCGICPPRT
ncbi:MAG: hypothetical protein ACYCX4_13420, partial [Bacillota bacterium]